MIQRQRRFVQDQDARIRQQGPRNTQSLTLSSRQLTSYDISLFEETRPPRRSRSEFQLPRPVREQILLQDTGVSQLLAAVRSLNVAKRHRQHSVASQNADGAHMTFEWVSGKNEENCGEEGVVYEERTTVVDLRKGIGTGASQGSGSYCGC